MSLDPISAVAGSPVASMAAAGGAVAPSAAPVANPPVAPLANPPVAAATAAQTPLAAMLAEAAMAQDSLAPLLADLAVAVQSPALPDEARATATQLLASQAPLAPDATGPSIQAALRGSGVLLEATLAAALQSGAEPPALQGDLKALLLRLVRDLAQPDPSVEADPRSATTAMADRPPPPLAGAALAGQTAARPSLDPQSSTATLVHTLRAEAQASLARLQLSQAASLPKADAPPRWSFEAPVATPAGTAMAQFEISRDGRGSSPEGASAEPTWRARFSLDAAPSGPVHVELALGDGRTHVRLMAEDDAARQALAAGQAELVQALASDETPDVTVRVTAGAPARPPPAPGQLLDRRS